MKIHTTTTHCDRCHQPVVSAIFLSPNDQNFVQRTWDELCVNEQSTGTNPWSRIHIKLIHVHGKDNVGKHEEADICKNCASTLLEFALRKLRSL